MKNLLILGLAIFFISSLNAQTVKDIDGNVYKTVTIGNQVWMAENLRTTKYNDGTPIPKVELKSEWASLKTDAYTFFNNEPDSGLVYGAFYNWFAVETDKLCPTGWHVPSDSDWKELEVALGMSTQEANKPIDQKRGSDQGSQLAGKAELWRDWDGEGGLERNIKFGSSGFDAIPSGYRSEFGRDGFIFSHAKFWTTSIISDNVGNSWPIYRSIMGGGNCNIFRSYSNRKRGLSVRCVKN